MAPKKHERAPLTSLLLDPRIREKFDEMGHVFGQGSKQGMLNAALLAFLRSSPDQQMRILKEWARFKTTPDEPIEHTGLAATR